MEASGFEEFDRQDVRIAVVMNGGVSLAVWISGVALELHHLVQASRADAPEAWPEYAAVLDLLHAKARVDVIAGTSAGGLNGGFLALGLVRDCDLGGMRDLWKNHGELEALLRDPLQRSPSSLLQGDDYFLPRVREAYRQIWQTGGTARDADEAPVELVLTGTLWNGRRSSFTGDMGTRITEIDYDATFRFGNDVDLGGDAAGEGTGDLRREAVIGQLAVASRCTSSFPGAFEPHWVTSAGARSPRLNDRWRSSGGLASALRVKRARNVGLRLVAASVLVLGALGALLWYDWSHNRSGSVVWGVLIKLGVALGVVLLGWWVAQVRGPAARTARRRATARERQAVTSTTSTPRRP